MIVKEQPVKVKMAIGIDNFRKCGRNRIIMWTRRG